MQNPLGKSLVKVLALALGIACTQSALAQHFKHVNVKGGAPLVQIAPGGVSVWARASNGNPYILKGSIFALANSISLAQIAVGGGNMLQKDAIWGLDSSGNIYRATKSGTSWVFSQAPGVLDFIAVGSGYRDACHPYEVWGLYASSIYRFNYCIGNWDFVPGSLASLAVGGGDIWGLNGDGQVFWFDFKTLAFYQYGTDNWLQVWVGPNDVWLLNSDFSLYEVPVDGGEPIHADGDVWTQIQVGGNGVWGLDPLGRVYRFDRASSRIMSVSTPTFVSISAGSGDGVWGLDSSGKAYGFTTP